MRRLNFVEDEPWDEVEDDKRVRWFGHPFGTEHLGASLIEYLPQAPGGPMHMHYGVGERCLKTGATLSAARMLRARLPRVRRDLPTATVTFHFTDVEGSTRLLHELSPARYAEALAEHRRILREAISVRGGVEVDTQ